MFTDVIFGRTTAIPDWELLTLSGLQRFHDFCGSEQELSPDLLAACRSALTSIASND